LRRDVFTTFRLAPSANDNVTVKRPGGDGTGSQAPLVATVVWDGTTVSCTDKISGQPCPYLPSATLLPMLPWPEGVETNGTDRRDAIGKAQPSFLRPKVFRYDNDPDALHPWIDLTANNGRIGHPPVSLDMLDRGATLRLVLSSPVYLAKNHWDDTVTPAEADIDPDKKTTAIDYTTLVFTLAIESDERVLVKSYRPGVTTETEVRRRLVLRDEKLRLWAMPKETLLGLKNDGQPDRLTAAGPFAFDGTGKYVLTRNDYPTAERRLKQACAWAFRERRAIAIELLTPDVPPVWATIGCLVVSLSDSVDTYLRTGDHRLRAALKLLPPQMPPRATPFLTDANKHLHHPKVVQDKPE
jgi:hypothetical protein